MRGSAPELVGCRRFERTVAMIDLSNEDVYVVDVFRVEGGQEHVKYVHSHFGQITTSGLTLVPSQEAWGGEQMRGFQRDEDPQPVWSVEWAVDDYLKYLPADRSVRLRYTDLTPDADVLTAEGWVAVGLYGGTADAWIPRLMVRRRVDEAPLSSTFVGVLEPYERQPLLQSVRRLELTTAAGSACGPADVALEIQLADGRRDVLVALDTDVPGSAERRMGPVVVPGLDITVAGSFAWIRYDAQGVPQRLFLGQGMSLEVGNLRLKRTQDEGWTEVDLGQAAAPIVSGNLADVQEVADGARTLWPR